MYMHLDTLYSREERFLKMLIYIPNHIHVTANLLNEYRAQYKKYRKITNFKKYNI